MTVHAAAPLAQTTRWVSSREGAPPTPEHERVESRHAGHIVAVAPDGTIVSALGDPERVTFLRSTVKPFQAAASLELADADLADDLVAVGWSSHRGERAQLEAVTTILERAGLGPDDLTTPEARPAEDSTRPASRLAHNCSGKHALFALAGRATGVVGQAVLDPAAAVQRSVLAQLDDVLGPPADVAVDGCGAPAVAAPLHRLASAYAALARPAGPWRRIAEAGYAHPDLVGGSGRLETALLAAGVVAKPGAEGVFAAGWSDARGSTWGLACKAEDGASRAASIAVHGFLVAAAVVDVDVWQPEPVLGGGRPAGTVKAARQVVDAGRALSSHRR